MRMAAALCLGLLIAGCASSRIEPALPTVLAHPEFLYPAVPPSLGSGAQTVDRGWRYLQNDDLRNAEREFTTALTRTPGFFPAQTGAAYVTLARRDHGGALRGFDLALKASPAYVPALVGRGQTLLALDRSADALASFESALAADSSLLDLRRRVEVLRFRNLQDIIEGAREAAAAGRLEDARTAYTRALDASPESAFLHRELGDVERRREALPAALEHLRRAVELDGSDVISLTQIGQILEQQLDFAGAEAAYRRAVDIEPTDALRTRIAAVAERARDARLPAEFRAIATNEQVTRGELAALIGLQLGDVIRSASPREVVMTDIAGHWASPWITEVARAGVIDPFENHTFQPGTRLRRGDLATAAGRMVTLLAATRPALRAALTDRPRIADMPTGHLNYPAASVVVAAGIMPLVDGGRFQVGRAVSGAEALEVITRLRALAAAR